MWARAEAQAHGVYVESLFSSPSHSLVVGPYQV
jgi:hypothetical protein